MYKYWHTVSVTVQPLILGSRALQGRMIQKKWNVYAGTGHDVQPAPWQGCTANKLYVLGSKV
jgi:hypothetical protein